MIWVDLCWSLSFGTYLGWSGLVCVLVCLSVHVWVGQGWSVSHCNFPGLPPLVWVGLRRSRLVPVGPGWSRLAWVGRGWSGLVWAGLGWSVVICDFHLLPDVFLCSSMFSWRPSVFACVVLRCSASLPVQIRFPVYPMYSWIHLDLSDRCPPPLAKKKLAPGFDIN